MAWEGPAHIARTPMDYRVTAVVPHRNTLDLLKLCIGFLQRQTEQPYIAVVDTGTRRADHDALERLRCENVEIHRIATHGHPRAVSTVSYAMDLALALCRTEWMWCVHSDCFATNRSMLAELLSLADGGRNPCVGYHTMPRNGPSNMYSGMVSHTCTLLHVPTLDDLDATWSLRRLKRQAARAGRPVLFDTEMPINYRLRDRGITPMIVGSEEADKIEVDHYRIHLRAATAREVYQHQLKIDDQPMIERCRDLLKSGGDLLDEQRDMPKWPKAIRRTVTHGQAPCNVPPRVVVDHLPAPHRGPPPAFAFDDAAYEVELPEEFNRLTGEPAASVIVPMYRSRVVIQEQIAAWDNPDPDHEIIYIDDCCPNASWKIVANAWRRHGIPERLRIRVVRRTENGGYAKATNSGARMARGRFLAFLNADCIPRRKWLSPLIERLASDATIGMTASLLTRVRDGIECIESAGSVWSWVSNSHEHIGGPALTNAPHSMLAAGDREMATGASVALSSGTFWEVGGYDDRYRIGYWEDVDLGMKLRQRGLRIFFEPRSIAMHYRGHSGCDGHKWKADNGLRFQQRWVRSGIVDRTVALSRHYNPGRIVVRRTTARGDVLLATGILAPLRARFPSARIVFQTAHPELLDGNPFVDEVVDGDTTSGEDWLCDLDDSYERLPTQHMLAAYAQIAGVDVTGCRPFIHRESHPIQFSQYIAMHPGPVGSELWKGRQWPLERFAEACERLSAQGVRIVLVGSDTAGPRFPPSVLDLRGTCNVHQTADVIAGAIMFAGLDSLPHHIAMAFNVPTVCIFGCTDYRLRAYRGNVTPLTVDLPCLGCLKRLPVVPRPPTCVSECPIGDEPCMKDLRVDAFMSAVMEVYRRLL